MDDSILLGKDAAAPRHDDAGQAGRTPRDAAPPIGTGGVSGVGPSGSGGVGGTGGGADRDASVGCVPNPDPEDEVCLQICPEVCNATDDDCDRHVDEDANASCKLPHASAACAKGACLVVKCDGTWRDCDDDPANGCEIAEDDPKNCGTCGHVCALDHAVEGCDAGLCVVTECESGWDDCDADPLDCETQVNSLDDCGACGVACDDPPHGTATCATGACLVDGCIGNYGDCDGGGPNGCEQQLNTIDDCGGCGVHCALGGGTDDCSTGVCKVVGCELGFAQCDGNPANGCEALDTPDDCGVCGKPCTPAALAHVVGASCPGAMCDVTCENGWGDCDGDAGNGCESELKSLANCGACALPCAIDHAVGDCSGGTCAFVRCQDGWDSCDANLGNGCEQDLDDDASCGDCDNACGAPKPVCSGGTCSAVVCPADKADCNGDGFPCEVSIDSDIDNCGACDNACQLTVSPGDAHGTLDCQSGACVAACAPGFDDCDGDYRNGCETPLDTLTNCGACGVGCAIANATASCAGSTCHVDTCREDYDDCDSDGLSCETPLDTIDDCGACGAACNLADAFAACGGAPGARSCEIAQCADAFHQDCDGADATGCESDSRTDTGNCGACGNDCALKPHVLAASCADSACVFDTCESGWADCGGGAGCETPVNTVQDCGACGNDCDVALPNTQQTACNPGTLACEVVTCDANFGNCDTTQSNGCEEPLDTLTNCRACGTACSTADPNGYPVCGASGCTLGCNGGLTPCSGACVDTNTSTSHCKGCGNVCSTADPNGYPVCGASGCTLGCNGGLTPCSGACVNTNTSTAHCKGCGNACPAVTNGAPVCGGGGCTFACNAGFTALNGECPTFGGAYTQENTSACPAGYTCYTANPYTAGCSCPSGFTAIGPFSHLDDLGWSLNTCPVGANPFGWSSTWVCRQGTYSTSSDFAGSYKRSASACLVGNPFNGNACSCPGPAANVKTIEMRVDSGCWADEFIGLCWNNAAARTTFGGAYQRSDYTGYGAGGCLVANPATGACSCPGGTSAISLRTIWGPDTGCSASGAFGAHIYVCRE